MDAAAADHGGHDDESYQSRTVCVIDASGHPGTTLVRKLLNMGYTLHAAVQTHGSLQVLKARNSGGSKKLRAFQYGPFDYQSIIDAIHDCSGIHGGGRGASCPQTETMEKVVFTSSITAVIWEENRKSMTKLDERNWSEPNFCKRFKLWYALAKTLAEKTAWALAMDRDVNTVTVNTGLVVAPGVNAEGVMVTVELEYLADALLYAFHESPTFGRYLCYNSVFNLPGMLSDSSTSSPLPCPPAFLLKVRI